MRKLALLFTLLCLILCGCQSEEAVDGIEFFTLENDIWTPVTSTNVTDPPATDAVVTDDTAEEISCTYVLNRSSKKFHDPACSSVAKIKDSNRGNFTGERQELLTRGYEPCKICNP